jgi:hypothetical protein
MLFLLALAFDDDRADTTLAPTSDREDDSVVVFRRRCSCVLWWLWLWCGAGTSRSFDRFRFAVWIGVSLASSPEKSNTVSAVGGLYALTRARNILPV